MKMPVHARVCVRVCMRAHAHAHVHARAHTHTHTHTHTQYSEHQSNLVNCTEMNHSSTA